MTRRGSHNGAKSRRRSQRASWLESARVLVARRSRWRAYVAHVAQAHAWKFALDALAREAQP